MRVECYLCRTTATKFSVYNHAADGKTYYYAYCESHNAAIIRKNSVDGALPNYITQGEFLSWLAMEVL